MSELDLTPILYPELYSEAEREAAQAQLKRDPEAQAQLALLIKVQATLEERAQRYAERAAEESPLSEAQRQAIFEAGRTAAQGRLERAAPLSLTGRLAQLFFSPQLAWLGVLSLALVSLWRLQDQPFEELSLQPVKVESLVEDPSPQAPDQLVRSGAPRGVMGAEVLQQPSPEQVASPPELKREALTKLERSPQMNEQETEPAAEPPKPIRPKLAKKARSQASKSSKRRSRKSKQRRKPTESKPLKRSSAKSKAKQMSSKRRSVKPITATRSMSEKELPEQSAPADSSRGSLSAETSKTYSPPPPPSQQEARAPSPRPPTASTGEASSSPYSPPPPATAEPQSSRGADQSERAQTRKLLDLLSDKSGGAMEGGGGDKQEGRARSAPWAEALEARARGDKSAGLSLLEAWLNEHMSHPRALEAAQLGSTWAAELKDERARRRFISYDRALRRSSGSGSTKSSAPKSRRRYNKKSKSSTSKSLGY